MNRSRIFYYGEEILTSEALDALSNAEQPGCDNNVTVQLLSS